MTKNRLILESAYSGNAKFYLYLIFAIVFFPTLFSLPLAFIGFIIDQEASLGFSFYIRLIIIVVILVLAIILFPLKKGLLTNEAGLFIGYFSWSKLIYKYQISLKGFHAVSILKFKRRQRGAVLSVANPEYSSAYNSFEVYTLNEKHTQRKIIIPLKKEMNARKAIDFISRNTDLKEEIYSPDFS